GSLSFTIKLASIHPTAKASCDGDDTLVMKGQVPGFVTRRDFKWIESRGEQWKYPELYDKDGKRKNGVKEIMYADEIGGLGTFFETRVRAKGEGGSVKAAGDALQISGADRVLLILTSGS